MSDNITLDPVAKLMRSDLNKIEAVGRHEARFMVDAYYMMQEQRIRTAHQQRTLAEDKEPHAVLAWLMAQSETLENQVKRALDYYSDADPLGRWARSIVGIGPVIAAGLIAHIDIAKAPTVGHIWRYAGLDPTSKWAKGQKRPWNAELKRLCWLIGESFVKTSNHKDSQYGETYKRRKALEIERNEAGQFKAQAEHILATKRISHDTDAFKAYQVGKLPPAHIHARACRYTVKLFLAHYHHVAYELANKAAPPKPYILTQPEHIHYIAPPNWPMPVAA